MAKFCAVLAAVGLLAAASCANQAGDNEFRRAYQRRQADLFDMLSSMPFPLPTLPLGGNGGCGGAGGGGVTVNVGGGGNCCNCGCPPPPPPPGPAPGPPAPGPPPAPWIPDPWTQGETSTPSSWWQPQGTTSGGDDQPVACPNDNDLVLVIDESGSIGQSNFKLVQDFAARLAEVWRTHPGNRVSVIFFSDTQRMYITLKDSELMDAATIKQKIIDADYINGGTSIGQGVDAARQELITNGRPGVPQNVVVLTDGESMDPQNTQTAASSLFSTGGNIHGFAVAVGAYTDGAELMAVAGQDQSHIFKVGDFYQLLNALRPISTAICYATQTTAAAPGK